MWKQIHERRPHWGLKPGPLIYKPDAVRLSYRGPVRGKSLCSLCIAALPEHSHSSPEMAQATRRGFEPLRAEPNGFLGIPILLFSFLFFRVVSGLSVVFRVSNKT